MTVEVRPVASRADLRLFRDLPTRFHGGDPAFVPVLAMSFRALFGRRNPFWRRARSREWTAWRATAPVGRIGACLDPALEAASAGCGAVGFFECTDDGEAAQALFAAADA